MFFDRFGVFPQAACIEIHFGLFGASRDPIDQFVAVLDRRAIEGNKKTLLNYLQKIGMPDGPAAADKFRAAAPCRSDIADLIALAKHGDIGEISLHAFPWKPAIDSTRDPVSSPARAEFVALLRSPLLAQKQLILALYEDR